MTVSSHFSNNQTSSSAPSRLPASQVSWAETICGIFAHRPNCRWPNCRFLLKFHHQSFDTECRAWVSSRRSHVGSISRIHRSTAQCLAVLSFALGVDTSTRRVGGLGARRREKLGCGTGDSRCDLLGSSHFVGAGCLESSWQANWLSRAQAATSITTTATLARQARPYRAQCGRDRSVTFPSRSVKGDQSWPMDRAARLLSAARSRPIRHA